MNNQPSEKHHHHHEPGSHRHKKRSSKSAKSNEQQPKYIPQQQNPTYDSVNTLENQSIPTNQSNDTFPDNENDARQLSRNHIFSMSEMKSLASFPTDEYLERINNELNREKKRFINKISDMIHEYANDLSSKYNKSFQNDNNRNSIGFSFNENFNHNYNLINSDDDNYINSSNEAKDTVKANSNIKKTNIIESDNSYLQINDDLEDNPKFNEQNTNDIFNDTNDEVLNANISKDDSNNNESKSAIPNKQDIPKKKRRKKVKSADANTSTNTANTTNTTENNTPKLNGHDSREEGEILAGFSIDSLADSDAPLATAQNNNNNNNFELSNKFDIEEESLGDGFSSEGKIVSNNSNRPALNNNNSKKIQLFDFGEFGKNDDDDASGFSGVI